MRASKNELQACKVEATAANARAIQLKQALNHANQELDSSRERTAAQLQVHRFGLERFSSDDDSIKFYTGFPSYQHILLFYNFLKPTAEKMTYCYASGILESRPTSRAMQLIDDAIKRRARSCQENNYHQAKGDDYNTRRDCKEDQRSYRQD